MTGTRKERLGTRSGRARRLIALLLGVLSALALIASRAAPAAAGTRVGAHHQNLILSVRVEDSAAQTSAGVRGPPQLRLVSATGVAAETGEGAAASVGRDAAKSCLNSFTGDTPVTMADGSTKPIKNVKVGDKVLATDPETGQTKAEPVVQLIRHSGEHGMVLISLADGSVLDSTGGHPIWDATTHAFTDASQLQVGDKIETTGGTFITVTALTGHSADLTAYNLQISTIHTYYAGSTPVLVHNSCASAAEILNDRSALEGLTPSQVDDLARNAGYEVAPGSASAANPATRYYVPGTNRTEGFYVLPRGVAGQAGIKGGPYLRFYNSGPNAGERVQLSP